MEQQAGEFYQLWNESRRENDAAREREALLEYSWVEWKHSKYHGRMKNFIKNR